MATVQTQNIEPVPSQTPMLEGDQKLITPTWMRWFTNMRAKINVINASIVAIAGSSGTGFLSSNGTGTIAARVLTAGSGITITNPDGVAGNPVISATASGGAPIDIVNNTSSTHVVNVTDLPNLSSNAGWIASNYASVNYVQIDTHANQAIPVGAHLYVSEEGSGTTSIQALTGVTLVGATITGVAKGVGEAVQIATDIWHVFGNLAYVSGGDIYWVDVVSLLHFDGTNGSTTFTDSKGLTTWTGYSSAALSTAQYKFAPSSLLAAGGPYIAANTPSAVALAGGDFTIECFIYLTTIGTIATIYASWNSASVLGIRVLVNSDNSIQFGTDGGSIQSAASVISANTWYYVAAVLSGSTATVYLNGTSIVSGSIGTVLTDTYATEIGRNLANTGWFFQGYIDELRVTKGIARYTSNFTPPTSPFSNF